MVPLIPRFGALPLYSLEHSELHPSKPSPFGGRWRAAPDEGNPRAVDFLLSMPYTARTLIRPLRGHLPPAGEGLERNRISAERGAGAEDDPNRRHPDKANDQTPL